MSRRRRDPAEDGHGRLLDAWTAPSGAGGPIGCLSTTYTFSAPFFEEECLGRFLGMETQPEESGAAYLIEREEKLGEVYTGIVVDRLHAAADQRSLAWDILPVRVGGGCMHAKVTLLVWANAMRVIVGSANCTEAGYRSNLEIFSVLDFKDGGGDDRALLVDVIAFLRDLVALSPAGPARDRAEPFLASVSARAEAWQPPPKAADVEVRVLIGGGIGGRPRQLLSTLRTEVWQDSRAPRTLEVVSPFFDLDPAAMAKAVGEVLARRGEVTTTFYVATRKDGDGTLHVQAPLGLQTAFPDAPFKPIRLEDRDEVRALHAKCLAIANDHSVAMMVGSSNFTSAGLGLGEGPANIEANLVYVVPIGSVGHVALGQAWPTADDDAIDLSTVRFSPAFDEGAIGSVLEDVVSLPVGFVSCVYDGSGLLFTLEPDDLPTTWQMRIGDAVIDDAAAFAAAGRPSSRRLAWGGGAPSVIDVTWTTTTDQQRSAALIVNVSSREILPSPEALRNLSLESLLDILTMARPIHEAVERARLLRRTATTGPRDGLDELQRVKTDAFLLQRTRRFSRALEGLKRRLEQPICSDESLRRRLRGPVGPLVIAQKIRDSDVIAGERAFQLTELVLLLRRLSPLPQPGTLPSDVVLAAASALADEIAATIDSLRAGIPADLQRYVTRALEAGAP
jgi:hypothetical protein